MATDIERLQVSLEANVKKFENALVRSERTSRKLTGDIEKQFERTSNRVRKHMDGLGAGVSSAATRLAAAAGTIASAGALKGYADDWQGAVNKIAAANNSLVGSQARASQLTDIAIRSFGDLGATADLYAGLTRSTRDMGASQAQVLAVTETLNKAFAVGGQSAATQAGALTQLNQALASGKLSGDEFNSVAEGAPVIMDLLARKLKVTRGELKELASDGKITSKVFMEALLEGGKAIQEQFEKLTPTIEQSLGRLKASVTRYFGQLATEQDWSGKMASGTQVVLDNLDNVMRAAAVVGVALLTAFAPLVGLGAAAGGIAAAATALALFGDQIQPVTGSIASLVDYARAAFQIIGQEGGGAFETFRSGVGAAAEALVTVFTGAVETASTVLATLADAVKSVLNVVIGTFVGAVGAISAAWAGLGPALVSTIYEAMNAVVRMVNDALASIAGAINAVFGKFGANVSAPSFKGIDNPYKGAATEMGRGIRTAFEEGLGKDYIGDVGRGIDGVLARIGNRARDIAQARRDDAGEMARRNAAAGAERDRRDGSLLAPLKSPAGKGAGGGGGGGGGGKGGEDAFNKELAGAEKRIEALNREREALALSAQEAAKAEMAHKLLDAAKAAGLPVNDALKAKIDQLSAAYANARGQLEQAKTAQQGFYDLQKFAGQSLSGFFSDIVSGGKNATEALMNLTKKLADAALQALLLGEGPLGKMFGLSAPGGKGVGGLIGMLFSGFGGAGAGGGLPGLAVGTSNVPADMPAMVHKGEMVIPKYDAALLRRGGMGGQNVAVTVDVRGATGNAEIQRMVAAGMSQAVAQSQRVIGRNIGPMVQNWQMRHG